MKRLLFLTVNVFIAVSGISQIDYKIEEYLDQHDIDSFLVYTFQCGNDNFLLDSCQWDEPHYLMWSKNGSSYLKRFDYCKTYKILSLDTINPLSFYLSNKKTIDKEEIKIPTYYETRKVRNKIERLISTSHASHSCFHKFRLSRESEYKYANTYDLDFNEFDNGKKNINYSYNQNTKFKKLIELTTSLLQTLEKENKFSVE